MTRWLLCALLCVRSLAYAADAPASDCDRLTLKLDRHLTPTTVNQYWGSGEAPTENETPARLELHGCKGELLDQMQLEAPLARLDKAPLRGTARRTYLVTVDLTAPMGSYSGPATMPVEVENHKLKLAQANADDGSVKPITLVVTGKADWKKVSAGAADDFLAVNCQPKDNGFVTNFRRYHLTSNGWLVRVRSEPIFWESDGEFPKVERFPSVGK